jgi:uncharacterized membrane protein YeaQ/YmgE (transglycosylase-associated protein family)
MRSWFLAGSHPQDYEQGLDNRISYNGKNSSYLKAKVAHPAGFGTLMQLFKADDYRNKRMHLSAAVKSEGLEGWAGLWMRIDGPAEKTLGFDNMQNRPIKGTTDWHRYEVVLAVPQESVHVAFGLLVEGKGQAWLSDVQFEEVSADVPTTSLKGDEGSPEKPGHSGISGDLVMALVGGFLGGLVVAFFFPNSTFHFWGNLIMGIIGAVILLAIQRFITRQRGRPPAKPGNLDFAEGR